MLNRIDIPRGQEAKLKYREADYSVIVPGSYVTCAVTGDPIPLDELKYWSFERQEPYIDARASFQAEQNAGKFR